MYQAGVLTCPAEKWLTLHRSCVLKYPESPSISEMMLWYSSLFSFWLGPIHCFTLLFFVILHISSLWRRQWWGIFLLSCLSAIVYSLSLSLNLWPGKSRHCACAVEGHCQVRTVRWRGAASSVCTRVIDTSQHSPWLWLVVLICEQWILASILTGCVMSNRQMNSDKSCYVVFCCLIQKQNLHTSKRVSLIQHN